MLIPSAIFTNRLILRNLSDNDVTERYLNWLHDDQIIRYLEVRHSPPPSTDALLEFVRGTNSDSRSLLLGIFDRNRGVHIGNIKLGPINVYHRFADIGFFIGERDCWGRGLASEAIAAVADYAFQKMGIDKLTAGCHEENVGSVQALIRAGFAQEARLRAHVVLNGRRVDKLSFGKIKEMES